MKKMPHSEQKGLNKEVLASMGDRYKTAYVQNVGAFKTRIATDSTDLEALLGLADTNILLFVFAYLSREDTIPAARAALARAIALDPSDAEVSKMSGILSFLDWEWDEAEAFFVEALERDPTNINARHWYSLFLVAMGRFDEAMAESDVIVGMDKAEDYLVGRGSLLYFQHRFEELKEIMHRCIAKDVTAPWGYDWLGMAYHGLGEHEDAIKTYITAFELSDGTAEVGAGLAHAAGLAGETEMARQMADFYAAQAKKQYVPPVQRAYIHIGLGEHDEAIRLLEQAYSETSWFLAFMKVEPWLDPLRDDERFVDILARMRFPG